MTDDPTKDLNAVEMLRLVLTDVRDMKDRLGALESLVEDRLKDTRPIWQAINQRTERIEARLDELTERVGGVEKELRTVGRKFEVFAEDHMRMRADIRDFDHRLNELERRPS
jgi:septal ring factor EnvC (AmiA/AmiB activator)